MAWLGHEKAWSELNSGGGGLTRRSQLEDSRTCGQLLLNIFNTFLFSALMKLSITASHSPSSQGWETNHVTLLIDFHTHGI